MATSDGLTPSSLECNLIWEQRPCRYSYDKMMLYWSKVGPEATMTGVLMRREETQR